MHLKPFSLMLHERTVNKYLTSLPSQ